MEMGLREQSGSYNNGRRTGALGPCKKLAKTLEQALL